MTNTTLIKLVCATSLGALAACGGSSNPRVAELQTLASTEDISSVLAGSSLQSNGTTGALVLATTTGTLQHDTGGTTLDDGTYALTDADGTNNANQLSDDNSTLTAGLDGFTGSYAFTESYEQAYTVDGVSYDSTGIVGIVIDARDMPASGAATFTGEALGTVNIASDGFDLTAGTSTVTATFSDEGGTVDLVMNAFTSTSQSGDETATNPIDTISALGMVIDGNSFSGGTITTALAGEDVDLLGGSATSVAAGHFFGYNSDDAQPDEVGGVLLMQGDAAVINGAFIAD